ncbi:MAG TPA: hypothetical protein VFL76_11435 [Edaphocola sp.]|nr:hypothetical protein [Edaphocola sp.]
MKIKFSLICALALGLSQLASGQKQRLTAEQKADKMVAGSIWQPFPLNSVYPVFDKGIYDFSKHQKPIFLYVGQKSCIICSYEFPTYAALAKSFPEIDFVYLTPDDTTDINKKFGKNLKTPNLFVIQITIDELWNKNIARVFPVKYFIDKNNIVVDAATGGTLKDRPALKDKWARKLKALLK